jgi:hypothetical protein
VTNYANIYESALGNINANKDLSKEQRAEQIKSLNARRTAYYNTVREMYDVDISFPTTGPKKPNKPNKPAATAARAPQSQPAQITPITTA